MPAELELVRVDLETARRLVAGGIRFARQNGFRLPRNHRRWAALLGDLGDPDSAELSDFGVDGGLRYIGSMEDLRRKLVGCSVEEFLARDDVKYVIGDDRFALEDDSDLALDEASAMLTERALDKVREWCFANGMVPHPRLRDALELTLEAALQVDSIPEEDEPDEASGAAGIDNVHRFLSLEDPSAQQELLAAGAQFQEFAAQYENAGDMIADLGLEELVDSE